MIFFVLFSRWNKKVDCNKLKTSMIFGRKKVCYFVVLVTMGLFYIIQNSPGKSAQRLEDAVKTMDLYEERLNMNLNDTMTTGLEVARERERLLMAIEERIIGFLYRIPDYSYIGSLETYLKYRPNLLAQFPAAVPLGKGDYSISSNYGTRIHPISEKEKKHYGIDLAAPSGTKVHATASGTIKELGYSPKGYGIYIVMRHRFGFETIYGHLEKVLVHKGETIAQHQIIGTLGNTGNSTGYHLHYEILKNKEKIDPRPSFDLKKKIYARLFKGNPEMEEEN
ncbi:M23 family metallopeptidase [Arenibacter sp. 6A1]|uniref:M23 family metallopeptidase n=1 Tax=Arenibacter sp. 6A1 TaxID=2720391 RepID=UPI001444B621|nr:M23 family metallopeptidase [Arenibacter sp. 6A1]NKI26875.1 M23 family metallopeptidase [Arenibacter sp. 6A1]